MTAVALALAPGEPVAATRATAVQPLLRDWGVVDHAVTWEAMRAFTADRGPDTPDELWLAQHPSVYTVGVAGRTEHLPRGATGIPVVRTDRGGQVTYHGPGQILLYTLLDLRRRGLGVRDLVRRLEASVVVLLGTHGVSARGDPERPGVYVGASKIASLGLKVRGGCAYHGLALNVDMDLTPFAAIDPCGYHGLAVTDARRQGIADPLPVLARRLAHLFSEQLHG